MKKTLRKPAHWQDFEELCRRLWGELWKVPNKIKKNGRLGQSQKGVDIYAIPKGETGYWGIQCKGKNDYTNAKLSKAEIDSEIENAKQFNPILDVFIIATTTNKDVDVEEYIREKDVESRRNGGFEILLYCWEDIVDLIEENRDTFNYYVNDQHYKDNFNFQVYLTDFKKEILLEPTFYRTIKRHVLKGTKEADELSVHNNLALQLGSFIKLQASLSSFRNNVNYALCGFKIIMQNEGNKVIEDWRFKIEFEANKFKKIQDSLGSGPMGMIDVKFLHKRTYCDDNKIGYRPLEDKPLVQNDNKYFEAWIEPLPKEYEFKASWELIARDYSAIDELRFIVKPVFKDDFNIIEVETEAELKEDEILDVRVTEYREIKR